MGERNESARSLQLSPYVVGAALAIIAVGVSVRAVCVFLLTLPMSLTTRKRFFVSTCFFPKATIQVAEGLQPATSRRRICRRLSPLSSLSTCRLTIATRRASSASSSKLA